MKELCFWSVADDRYAYMLQTLVHSYHAAGMQDDFYVICDRDIEGATTHHIKKFDKNFFFFKFFFLKNIIKNLEYKYFIYLDADNYFVRKPPPFHHLLQNSPIHAFLESDCTLPSIRKEWHSCPLPEVVRLMRECGITEEHVYAVNGGYFMVKREAIDTICDLAQDFWKHSFLNGYVFTEEPSLAYATQMLCENPQEHLQSRNSEIWCSDWLGQFARHLPDGKPWTFADYMNYETCSVNPAIVHAIKSKELLIAYGERLIEKRPQVA